MPQDKCLASLWNLVQGEFQGLNIQIYKSTITMRQTCEHEDTDFRKKLTNMTEVKRTLPSHLYQIYPVHDHPQNNDKKIKVKNLNTNKGNRKKEKTSEQSCTS